VCHHISNAVYLHVLSLSEISTLSHTRATVGAFSLQPGRIYFSSKLYLSPVRTNRASLLARQKVQPAGYNYLRNGQCAAWAGRQAGHTAGSAANFHLSDLSVCLTASNVCVSLHRKYIPLQIQQDATLHSLFTSGNCSTCFGWYLHPSS
jgi:hypothetical protein